MAVYRRRYKRLRKYRGKRRVIRKNYRKKRMNASSRVVVKGPTVIPDRYFVKLKYADNIVIGSAVLSYFPYVFRGNSIYDPDYSGTGHQPMGMDQLTNLYSDYTVFASKITIKFINNLSIPLRCYVVPTTLSTSITDSSTAEENPYAKRAILTSINGKGVTTINHFMTTRKIFGLTKVQDVDDNYGGTVAGSPSNVWYWQLFIQSVTPGGTLGLSAATMDIKVTYYVEFNNKTMLGQS